MFGCTMPWHGPRRQHCVQYQNENKVSSINGRAIRNGINIQTTQGAMASDRLYSWASLHCCDCGEQETFVLPPKQVTLPRFICRRCECWTRELRDLVFTKGQVLALSMLNPPSCHPHLKQVIQRLAKHSTLLLIRQRHHDRIPLQHQLLRVVHGDSLPRA